MLPATRSQAVSCLAQRGEVTQVLSPATGGALSKAGLPCLPRSESTLLARSDIVPLRRGRSWSVSRGNGRDQIPIYLHDNGFRFRGTVSQSNSQESGAVGGYQIRRRDSLAAAQLYFDAAEFELDLPDLTVVEPDEVATVLLSRFFTVWEEDTTFVALLRASMTSPTAADTMRQVIRHPGGAVTPCHHARSPRRAGRIDGRVRHRVGHMARYVLANPAVANLSHDELICWAAPVICQRLAGPAPT